MVSDGPTADAGGERRGEILAFPRLGTLVCLVFHTKGTVVPLVYCSGARGYRCRRRRTMGMVLSAVSVVVVVTVVLWYPLWHGSW